MVYLWLGQEVKFVKYSYANMFMIYELVSNSNIEFYLHEGDVQIKN